MANMMMANIPGSFMGGMNNALALQGAVEERDRAADMREFFAAHGPALARGDASALEAYARLDPMQAYSMGMDQRRLSMQQQQMGLQQQRAALEMQRLRSQMSDAEAAANAQAMRNAAARASMIDSIPEFNAYVESVGQPEMKIDPSASPEEFATHKEMNIGMVMTMAEILDSRKTGGTEADREIQRLMNIGIPYDTAVKIKEGVYKIVTDPVTKDTVIWDLMTQQPVNIGTSTQATQATPAQSTTETLQTPALSFPDQYGDAPNAFGMEGMVRGGINAIGDFAGFGQVFPETAQTQADFGVLKEKLIADIAGGYRRQPPSWLLQNIRDLTPTAGGFQGPEGARTKLTAIAQDFVQEKQKAQSSLQGRINPERRQLLTERIQALDAALARVGAALRAFDETPMSEDDRALIEKYLK